MTAGRLISLSGLDGAGKSTQLELLRRALEARGQICAVRMVGAEHYGAAAGAFVTELQEAKVDLVFTRLTIDWGDRYPLIRDFVSNPELQTRQLAAAVAMVFAGASVQAFSCCIRPLLESGIHVVCDRYWYDDVVYRGMWLEESFVRSLYSTVRAPDLRLYLDASVDSILRRNSGRDDGKSPLMRSSESVAELRRRFVELAGREDMKAVDGDRAPELVSDELIRLTTDAISR